MGGWFGTDKPASPNLAGANEAGVWADIETMGIRKMVADAARFGKSVTLQVPTFDAKGNKTLDESGKPKMREVTYDFKGYSDADATREDMEFGGEAADFMAKTMLEVQQKYGKDFVKQRIEELKAADPTGYEVRQMLGEAAKEDLARGTELSPDMARQVTQQERAAQSARGNIYGSAPAAAEAMSLGDAGFRMRQQRLANAASFLSGTTPVAQFGQISGAQAGASPFNPMGIQAGIGVNPNAGAQGQQWAMNAYNTQMNYAAQQQPIGAQLLGMATGVATGKITDSLLGP
tara:strand:- start:2100 stop:2969 length:870 start_codon:yes stop_codon:yes gene_type:complete